MNIERLASTAKRLDILFRILQRVVVVCATFILCVLTALTIFNAINPKAVIGTELNVLEFGPLAIELTEEYTPNNAKILAYVWFYATLGVLCAVIMYIGLRYIRKILQPMTEGRPFQANTTRYVKKLAVLSLILGIVQNIGNIIEASVVLRTFGLTSLVDHGVIRSVSANYTFDFGFIIVFFVLLLMSYIFSYGSELQNLSDETL